VEIIKGDMKLISSPYKRTGCAVAPPHPGPVPAGEREQVRFITTGFRV
jgi:hypothetical protein